MTLLRSRVLPLLALVICLGSSPLRSQPTTEPSFIGIWVGMSAEAAGDSLGLPKDWRSACGPDPHSPYILCEMRDPPSYRGVAPAQVSIYLDQSRRSVTGAYITLYYQGDRHAARTLGLRYAQQWRDFWEPFVDSHQNLYRRSNTSTTCGFRLLLLDRGFLWITCRNAGREVSNDADPVDGVVVWVRLKPGE